MSIEIATPSITLEQGKPMILRNEDFEIVMECLAMTAVVLQREIEAKFAEVAANPDVVQDILLDEWMGNLTVRMSRIIQQENAVLFGEELGKALDQTYGL